MTKVQHSATLDERSVKRVATGQVKRRRRSPSWSSTTPPKWHVKANDLAWAVAKAIQGPGTRLKIVSENEVLIVNDPRP